MTDTGSMTDTNSITDTKGKNDNSTTKEGPSSTFTINTGEIPWELAG